MNVIQDLLQKDITSDGNKPPNLVKHFRSTYQVMPFWDIYTITLVIKVSCFYGYSIIRSLVSSYKHIEPTPREISLPGLD